VSAQLQPLERWRLLLGEAAHNELCGSGGTGEGGGLSAETLAMDRALEWLYGREGEGRDLLQRERSADLGASALSIPDWINQVHTLFPRETIERLERDAVEHYRITELVTRPEVLQRVQPSQALLEAVLHTKHLMNPEVLAMARELVAKVVQQLIEALAIELQQAFSGVRNRRQHTRHASARNFDAAATLRANLKHYDPERRRLVIERALFNSRSARHLERWQIILVVDQSGSMVSSVIHSAVTAACLSRLPGIDTHLLAFDTQVVNLTDERSDPVELLMKVQLGGGTDIQKAMRYAADLIEAPRRAIVVLISDFYEGGPEHQLVRVVADLVAQGSRVLGLAALDQDATPAYDRAMAARLVEVGAEVGAMTPGQLAGWLADVLRRNG
jgi:hypothetical protein